MKTSSIVLVFFTIAFSLSLASPAEASINGWMIEALKMLEEKNLVKDSQSSTQSLPTVNIVSASEILNASNRDIATSKTKTIATIAIELANKTINLAEDMAADVAQPLINTANAETSINEQLLIEINKDEIKKDFLVSAFNNSIKLSLASNTFSSTTSVEIVKLNEYIDEPWRLKRVSPVYQFEVKNKEAYSGEGPIEIQLTYDKNDGMHKEIFFFDKGKQTWRPLPSTNYASSLFVKSKIYLPFARIAVFSYPEVMTEGKASWYKYENGDFAASPDFAKGSILRVINIDNNKSIDIAVNDWGPERDLFPDRVIDLDKVAFGKIASVGAGIINVRVEPLVIASSNNLTLGLGDNGAAINPGIKSSSAIVWREEDGEIIYGKEATSTLPIASLTKLIAIKTFFDTRPSLNKIVAYKDQDELNNHRYVDQPWRIAKLKLEDGDQVILEDLLYASLIGSSNNTVETIVRASGLSRDEFVAKMNVNVKRWGAHATYFIEPTGLAPENTSTVADYAIITKELFKNPLIKKVSKMKKYRFKLVNRDKEFVVVNRNHLILKNTYRIVGSKTGYLDEAGYCLMTRVRTPDQKHIIIVLLGADSRQQTFSETEELIQYALLNSNK